MKKLLTISTLALSITTAAHSNGFQPYIGADAGLNIVDYNTQTTLDDTYYSGTINLGARIGRNFGTELFFTHSSTNELEYVSDFTAINHEIYYMAFGFDIFGYYNITRNIDFFTSFGVANYKLYGKTEFTNFSQSTSEKQSDNNVSTRLGIGLMLTMPWDNLSMLFQYQYTNLSNEYFGTMSEFSLGFRYNF